ncbi:MAG: hypothetical protein LBE78_13805 [Burkholderiaceae bacterium]|jgi:4-amino-4-deoxy-L-arabinose transferase-like glycosyltransferase|nr:hypothetical protein [Burkholderiaceae bacterium]
MSAQPSPAIVAQDAVRRLPRPALLLLCLVYVIAGYVGRAPWRNADIASFGYMLELAAGRADDWFAPTLMGVPTDSGALLPYWLGAWAMRLAPSWMAPDFAVRIPFALMLAGTLAATWYAVYSLARHPAAQPVAFAFGGEASPVDYARALADGALLALIATLGLMQFSHETTPALTQLFCGALVFHGLAALPYRPLGAPLSLLAGLPGLALSGAPATALIYGGWSLAALLAPGQPPHDTPVRKRALWSLGAAVAISLALAWALNLFRWQIAPWRTHWNDWRSVSQLFVWFTWPVWPLALWTLWRWRQQLAGLRLHRYLGLPLMIASVPLVSVILTRAGDRALLLALPALAALAAFALPTFKRSAAALMDWFTVLFFTGLAIFIWVYWIAMQTGVPAKLAANVARLAPDFESVFQWPALAAALLGTLAWIALARWRIGRHRPALWKSLVLPAAGATLCWLLAMTLWLPALDYGRGYAPQMSRLRRLIGDAPCVQVHGLGTPQVAALRFHGGWAPEPANEPMQQCPWLLVDAQNLPTLSKTVDLRQWRLTVQVPRQTDKNETLLVYQRSGSP